MTKTAVDISNQILLSQEQI